MTTLIWHEPWPIAGKGRSINPQHNWDIFHLIKRYIDGSLEYPMKPPLWIHTHAWMKWEDLRGELEGPLNTAIREEQRRKKTLEETPIPLDAVMAARTNPVVLRSVVEQWLTPTQMANVMEHVRRMTTGGVLVCRETKEILYPNRVGRSQINGLVKMMCGQLKNSIQIVDEELVKFGRQDNTYDMHRCADHLARITTLDPDNILKRNRTKPHSIEALGVSNRKAYTRSEWRRLAEKDMTWTTQTTKTE